MDVGISFVDDRGICSCKTKMSNTWFDYTLARAKAEFCESRQVETDENMQ